MGEKQLNEEISSCKFCLGLCLKSLIPGPIHVKLKLAQSSESSLSATVS